MESKKAEFHTIDALRFFAFLKVYLLHLYVARDFGLFSTLKQGGGIGVVFFFVLSGFLITYLLTFSKLTLGKIDLPRFYARRILRIWPLFFLFLLIIYLMPSPERDLLGFDVGGYMPDWRWSFSFLENYQIIRHQSWPAYGPLLVTWSLCVEEHFYIVWGVLLAFVPLRRISVIMALLIAIAISARIACRHFLPLYDIASSELITSMDYFACGGIVGYLYATRREAFEEFIGSIPLWVRIAYIGLVIGFVFGNKQLFEFLMMPRWIWPFIQSAIFAALIAIVIPRQSEIRIGHRNVLSYLGRISYGLYLFHGVVIMAFVKYLDRHHIQIVTVRILCLSIIVTFSVSVLLASFFYHFFEKPFISLKKYL